MKELGVVLYNCSCLALDLHRVFSLYSQLQYKDHLPSIWSKRLTALYSKEDVLKLQLNGTKAEAYVSVSASHLLISRCGPANRILSPLFLEGYRKHCNHGNFREWLSMRRSGTGPFCQCSDSDEVPCLRGAATVTHNCHWEGYRSLILHFTDVFLGW